MFLNHLCDGELIAALGRMLFRGEGMNQGSRYFAVKIKLYMPWVSNPRAWSSTYIEDLLFDQEEYRPSHAYIEESAKEAFGLFDRIEILNIEELTKADFEHITKDGDWTDF